MGLLLRTAEYALLPKLEVNVLQSLRMHGCMPLSRKHETLPVQAEDEPKLERHIAVLHQIRHVHRLSSLCLVELAQDIQPTRGLPRQRPNRNASDEDSELASPLAAGSNPRDQRM